MRIARRGTFLLFLLLFGCLFCARGVAFADAWAWTGHYQATVVTQYHDVFPAAYSGLNSLPNSPEIRTSFTSTLFLGSRLLPGLELYVNPELEAGSGIGSTLGLAGYSNGEIYRVSDPYPLLDVSRLYLQWTLGFGGETETLEDGINQVAGTKDISRLTLLGGKFSLNDFFDDNTYSHDPRTQFLNWALMDFGAWDYAADTRGYTMGLCAELNQKGWALRFAEVQEPLVANQLTLDRDITHAHAENVEAEARWSAWQQPGKLRLLGYWNHAHMGNYQVTLDTAAYQMDITRSRVLGNLKYGFGLNVEQQLGPWLGFFSRLSWNDGTTESWAFTEIDRSGTAGLQAQGGLWGRAQDHAGLAYIINGLSDSHRAYLAAGGYGFMIGDGALNYAPEQIIEAYYSVTLLPGLSLSPDYQYVQNPAYNQDRGPVHIFAIRAHYEL